MLSCVKDVREFNAKVFGFEDVRKKFAGEGKENIREECY